MDKHYICTGGCEGVSNIPGNCRASSCAKFGMDLKECACEDHRHWGAFNSKKMSPGHDLSVKGLGIASAVVLGIGLFVSSLITFLSDTTAGIGTMIVDTLIGAIGGLIIGAAIAWFYNKFKN